MNYFPLDPNLNVCRCSSKRTLIVGLNFNTRSNLCTLSEIGRSSISMQIALFRERLLCTAGGGGVSRLKYLILILPIRIFSYIPMIPPSLTVNWHSYSPPFFILCRRQLIPPLFPQKITLPPPPSRSYPVINRLVLQLEFIRGQLSVMNSCIYQAA